MDFIWYAQGQVLISQSFGNKLKNMPKIDQAKLIDLTDNGFVKTSGGVGTLGVDTATYALTNQTMNIGTTGVAINRASAAMTLAGITLTTPDIGTPSAGVLSSCTGLPYSGLADGTDGNLITWDAAGKAALVTTGNAGQVLTSNGAGAAPTFQAAAGGGLVWGASVSGTTTGGTWISAGANTSVEYNLTGTAFAGGRIIASGYFTATASTSVSIDILKAALFSNQLERDGLTGTPYEFTVALTAGTNNESVFASMDWEEISR
jgi:hypothetical protein